MTDPGPAEEADARADVGGDSSIAWPPTRTAAWATSRERRRAQIGSPAPRAFAGAQNAYAISLFAVLSALALADRNIFNLLLAPIQREIHATDTAMAALSSTVFVVVYAVGAIPLSRLADRGDRRRLLAASAVVWSLATVLCGAASTYMQLLVARLFVAGGEAGAPPATTSIIGDIIPRERRGGVFGLLIAGSSLGVFLGSYVGGVTFDHFGWRMAFLALGAPGMLVGLLILLTVNEPRRGASGAAVALGGPSRSVWRDLRGLLQIPSLRGLLVAQCLLQMAFLGWMTWIPTFLLRIHHLSMSDVGLYFGASVGIGSFLASLAGGFLGDRLAKHRTHWYLRFCAIVLVIGMPFNFVFLPTHSTALAVALFLPYATIVASGAAPASAAAILLVSPERRGLLVAVSGLCTNLIGGGLGPLIVGRLSDLLRPAFGTQSLRYALYVIPLLLLLAAAAFLMASRTFERDAQLQAG